MHFAELRLKLGFCQLLQHNEKLKVPETHILISGCSGGGKSSVLSALHDLGFKTVPEPGRRIVAKELSGRGEALPWVNLNLFAQRAIRLAEADLASVEDTGGFVFFDRGVIDAAVAFEFSGGTSYRSLLGRERHYAKRVFLAPPWPKIFVTDAERRHGLDQAEAEYMRLVTAFSELGYEACELPKAPVQDRVEFILDDLRIS